MAIKLIPFFLPSPASEVTFQDMREADGHRRALPRIDGCHDVTAYVVRISELMAEVEDLRAERDAGKWSREMRAELTADAAVSICRSKGSGMRTVTLGM